MHCEEGRIAYPRDGEMADELVGGAERGHTDLAGYTVPIALGTAIVGDSTPWTPPPAYITPTSTHQGGPPATPAAIVLCQQNYGSIYIFYISEILGHLKSLRKWKS